MHVDTRPPVLAARRQVVCVDLSHVQLSHCLMSAAAGAVLPVNRSGTRFLVVQKRIVGGQVARLHRRHHRYKEKEALVNYSCFPRNEMTKVR